jgi:soluble lytic murein transglycosylase
MIDFHPRHTIVAVISLVIICGALIAPLLSASCSTQQTEETKALEQLRAVTRNGVLPAESVLLQIESDYPNTKAAALARIVRARVKMQANDPAAAAQLLSSNLIREKTLLGDDALMLRAQALEAAQRPVEARAAYEELARNLPSSRHARTALLRVAQMALDSNQATAVSTFLKDLIKQDDASALLLSARAYERTGDTVRALAAYRRIYFYQPNTTESADAAIGIVRLGSTVSPATIEEATTRADKLFAAQRYSEAADAYAQAFARFPSAANAETQLRRGISLSNLKRTSDAVIALNSVPSSAGETRSEALYYLARTFANARQWNVVRSTLDELRRAYPQSSWTPRAYVSVGQVAEDAKNDADASFFFRTAVNTYPNSIEVAQAQFDFAWMAHEARNFQDSARLLTDHLALYADRNTDNRGRAGYWAARDYERMGRFHEARALYEAMQIRYGANWYGYLAKLRLDEMRRNNTLPASINFTPDSQIVRAIKNLQTVMVAKETTGPAENARLAKANQLTNIGLDDWALEELNIASETAPLSPRVNLAIARIYRAREDNVRALNTLKRSFPDYSQMHPEELTREEWDIFYPLAYWDIIVRWAEARSLDPHQVAGLIRQESVFNPRARSSANAYGLMQVLVPTGRLIAQRYGVESQITPERLYQPALNIELGTAYMRDQINKYGRIEYVAAAYNAGPNRVVQWRASLPSNIDEWAEAIPFKETRGYVQGVVRNTLQYERLYDDNGNFRPTVGTRVIRSASNDSQSVPAATQPTNSSARPRRANEGDEQEE